MMTDERGEGVGDQLLGDESAGASIPFVVAVERAAQLQGCSTTEMCRRAGIAPAYWNMIAKGSRPASSLSDDQLRKVAAFMGVPYVQVMMLAEILSLEDVMDVSTVDQMFDRAMLQMCLDPQWAGLVPQEVEIAKMSRRTKALIVLMYERVFGREVLKKATAVLVEGASVARS